MVNKVGKEGEIRKKKMFPNHLSTLVENFFLKYTNGHCYLANYGVQNITVGVLMIMIQNPETHLRILVLKMSDCLTCPHPILRESVLLPKQSSSFLP